MAMQVDFKHKNKALPGSAKWKRSFHCTLLVPIARIKAD
ncbi:hypothetical protein GJA_1357 [Janthinobacterium agaricidamnosum NBRC 102515 = DSM 9628]|uniref:Uncharacterized protein n=1 Tax=Janthinobacterium agaricidamnosum NBRC 102515 = DSM 9628 TaxID=1349767 RepID=W0V354_9BURK|nr:hypothetical protein GJA_1357 [Janthinobacterium agaricidamnosum NBRC 102515 = DSM 9628]